MFQRTDLSDTQPHMHRRQFLRGALGAAGLATAAGLAIPARASAAALPPDPKIAADIRAEFLHAWNGYKQFAWGHDQLLPLSASYQEFFVPGHPVGLSIVEALDTLYVMGLDDELTLGVDWIKQNLDFDIDGDFHVFEWIIRVIGGLLAGYLATGDSQLLALTKEATDRILPAFTQSPHASSVILHSVSSTIERLLRFALPTISTSSSTVISLLCTLMYWPPVDGAYIA